MRIDEINLRLAELSEERTQLRLKETEIGKEQRQLTLERDLLKYTCACVRLNSDLGIYTSAEQNFYKRKPLQLFGLVYETLSADKDCLVCKGTGK